MGFLVNLPYAALSIEMSKDFKVVYNADVKPRIDVVCCEFV